VRVVCRVCRLEVSILLHRDMYQENKVNGRIRSISSSSITDVFSAASGADDTMKSKITVACQDLPICGGLSPNAYPHECKHSFRLVYLVVATVLVKE